MPFDGFMTGFLCIELNERLMNAKISKIYQPSAYHVLFEIYSANYGNIHLRLCAGSTHPHIAFTNLHEENPLNPSSFCMLLRKHLLNGKIKKITQNAHDRILTFEIEQADEIGDLRIRYLVCELTGKNANIILTDESLFIIDSIKKVDASKSSVRQILPKHTYQLPPSDKLNPYTMQKNEFENAMKSVDLEVKEAIVRVIDGASNAYAQYILSQLDAPGKDHISAIFDIVKKSLHRPEQYYIFEKDTIYTDLYFFNFYKDAPTIHAHSYGNILTLCTSFYDNVIIQNNLKQKTNLIKSALTPLIKRANNKLEKINRDLSESKKKENYNTFGQLLLTYSYDIKNGVSSYDAVNIFSEDNSIIKIPLDKNLTVFENAEKYFKKYKKSRNAISHLENQAIMTSNEIAFLTDQLYYAMESTTDDDANEVLELLKSEGYIKQSITKQNQTTSVPHHFISSDGFDIYVGKNDKQNEFLTHKFAKKQDIWLHTKIIAGSHVIIKTNAKQVPKNTLLEAAHLSAFFSKARNGQNIPIDYTTVSYVRKIKNAPPGKVTYTNYSTIYITPDEALVKSLKAI
jgi:predicted ribosome quality control (RQC) complex YloA/Tae2 family protein